MAQYFLGAPPRHPRARVSGYLVKFTANYYDEPVAPGDVSCAIIGRLFKDEFEARAFWAAHKDDAQATWIGEGDWRFDPIQGIYTDANRPGRYF